MAAATPVEVSADPGRIVIVAPDLAWVLEDDRGVCGYCLATADSEAFYDRYEKEWRPSLMARFPEPTGAPSATTADELWSLSPALLLIPALAVDGSGTRLGQGGGYYDASLAATRHRLQPHKIGVGFACQRHNGRLPREAHDMRLDGFVCEHGWRRF